LALTADVKDELARIEVESKTTVRAAELATILRFSGACTDLRAYRASSSQPTPRNLASTGARRPR
jgi:DNA-binding transcriptional regulator WhiA